MKRIDSPQNPTVKALMKLKERRYRERERRFLIEGTREISRALGSGVPLQALYLCPDLMRPEGRELVQGLEPSVEPVELSRVAFEKVSYRDHPDGLMAVAAIQKQRLAELSLPDCALVLVVDGLEKPGNLGALLRTADGADLDAVFVTGEGTDLYNPNVIRASMGSVFSRPVLAVEMTALVAWLGVRAFTLVAASPHARLSYWDADYRGPTAIILGTEHEGLSADWLDVANVEVSIPMPGLADSLNVATAGALLVYEALRQRS